jgi:hypothetical protein
MTPHEFIQKWQAASLSERSAYQQHFLDLCELLGQPKPAAADPEGAWYTFERGVRKTEGGNGWADVWMRGHFGWEYKGKHKNLAEAYKQLLQYREDLENPPLLLVCDLDRFEVHTNFTGTVKRVYAFDLAGLDEPKNLDVLRRVFTDPDSLRPGQTTEAVTREAAELIGHIADGMRVRGIAAHDAAHFLMKLMFSMFADDIGLLRNKVFTNTLKAAKDKPAVLAQRMKALFEAMSTGGYFGADEVLHFDGGLFADAEVIELKPEEIRNLIDANGQDWSSVEPSIFGTLFERTLDPDKRSQIGAHYTSRADIETLLQPVMMQPLRREWEALKAECDQLWAKVKTTARKRGLTTPVTARKTMPKRITEATKTARKIEKRLETFIDRLESVTVLDPACGSGNFLYAALKLLLDLNKEVISYAAQRGINLFPSVRPTQLLGIEKNDYAQELASVVIWIGYLQWMHDNGFTPPRDPVLEPFESIRPMDAILDLSDVEHPREPRWPAAEFIVGNPPFLGGNRIRRALGDVYVNALFRIYEGRVPAFGDLCCYWLEKARQQIRSGTTKRAGLLATQSIRGGVNRAILDQIKATGDIFFAESDRDWILDGASVHVSMVGYDDASEQTKLLDGQSVSDIASNLSSSVNVNSARRLNAQQCFHIEGVKKGATFQLDEQNAIAMISEPNPHGRSNSDIIRPYINGADLNSNVAPEWLVYFPSNSTECEAALYEKPFAYVREHVYPKYGSRRRRWWILERPRPEFASINTNQARYLGTVKHSPYRLFVWVPTVVLLSNAIEVFATENDYVFGVLQSSIHERWARAPGMGTQVRERESGFRYTPTTCFETFPFPESTDAQSEAIADAARELDRLRNNWLNPPEWTKTEVLEFAGSIDGPWRRYIDAASADKLGIGTVTYPRVVPKDEECAKHLKKRTLTNLYNDRPTWLDLVHKKLDAAVFEAYGWDSAMSDDDLLAALLALNLERASSQPVSA